MERVDRIISSLMDYYRIDWNFGDPFRVIISTILSQRTRDENTELASRQLFSVYKNPEELAEAEIERIQELIKPSGFYKTKARRIKEVARMIRDRFNGMVPDEIDALLSLPGVGRKTANCVLLYGFGKPAIPVDTHVHRIVNRIGLVKTKTPYHTELSLMEILPKRYWRLFNELLVKFGKEVCRPIRPRCWSCMIKDLCGYKASSIKSTINFI